MNENTAQGHSIWLTPDASTAQAIQNTIEVLGTKFNSPTFPPHITLLGQVNGDSREVLETFDTLAKGIKPFELDAPSIGFQGVFFRSLFYKISENHDLLELNHLACELFKRNADPAYFPHLSLLYSHESESQKRAAVQDLNIESPLVIPITGIELIQTQGLVKEWKMVKRIELI